MAFDTIELIAQAVGGHVGPARILAFGAAAAASAATALSLIGPLGRRLLAPPGETWLSDANPFEAPLSDGTTLLCKDGSCVATIRLAGIDLGTTDAARRRDMMVGRQRWIENLAGKQVSVRCFTIRRRRGIDSGPVQGDETLRQVIDAWHRPFEDSYENIHVIVLTIPGSIERARDQLNEAVEQTLETLAVYRPKLLRHLPDARDRDSDPASELLTFWNELWNPVAGVETGGAEMSPSPAKKGGPGLAQRMRADNFETVASSGLLRFTSGDRQRYAYVVAVADLGDASSDRIVGDLSTVDAQVTVLQRFTVEDRSKAGPFVEQRGRMAVSGRAGFGAQETRAQFQAAAQLLSPDSQNPQALAYYELVVFCFGSTPEEARQAQGAVRAVFRDWRINPITDTHVAPVQWFGQFPTYETMLRSSAIMGQNAAEFVNFENVSTGYRQCMWGNFPTLVIPTARRTPYGFIFHETPAMTGEPLGHTVVFGRTGSGKSTVVSMIAAGALRYPNLRVFMLDRHRGLYVFTKALGGDYISIDSALSGGGVTAGRLEPLQVAETQENHQHLINWLRIMSGVGEMDLKPDAKAQAESDIASIVKDVFKLAPADRRLERAVRSGAPPNSIVAQALSKWIDPKQLGAYFNNPPVPADQRLRLNNRLTTFDMTETFDQSDRSVAAAICLEIIHRIKMTMKEERAPALIVIDEAVAMLRDPGFRQQVKTMLLEFRKLGGTVVLMFQTPDALDQVDPSFAELLKSQMANQFWFRDTSSTTAQVYEKWGLGQREVQFVRQSDPRTQSIAHAMLLRRPGAADQRTGSGESVILNVDYSPLGEFRHFFASGKAAVELAIERQRTMGDGWRRSYIDTMEEIAASGGRRRRDVP